MMFLRRGACVAAFLAWAGIADAQTESSHREGPDGLVGWTVLYPVGNQGELPKELVVTRNGEVVRTIEGDPFVWKWLFMENGTQIAYEAGRKNVGMACILADIATGAEVDSHDCYDGRPIGKAPDWVQDLMASGKDDAGN